MLKQATENIWFLPFEEATDRPCLYYVQGSRLSLAVDAGNSPAHVEKFYAALQEAGLPLPSVTAITHWHWDHTFGLPRIQGTAVASRLANEKLRTVQSWQWTPEAMSHRERTGEDIAFCNQCIRAEYPDLQAIQVLPAQQELDGALSIDLGSLTCQLFTADSPHSRDALYIWVPEEEALAVGDATCEDYYDNNGQYDPEKLRAHIELLEGIPFTHCLLGHSDPCTKDEILAELREREATL